MNKPELFSYRFSKTFCMVIKNIDKKNLKKLEDENNQMKQ